MHPDGAPMRLPGVPTVSESWPSTPLAAAQRAFDLLTCAPAPLAFDCRGIAGMPPAVLPLDELKRVLIADETPRSVRDTVWRELVIRARRDGPAWVAAAGIAMPGLLDCSPNVYQWVIPLEHE